MSAAPPATSAGRPARLAARLRGEAPPHKLLASDPGQAGQAQRSDIDNAINVFANEVGGSLPEPWSRTVRAAARSRADEAQSALGTAVAQGLPRRDKVTGWWRLVALAQWLLMALMLTGLIWIVLILAFGESSGARKSPSLINDVSLAPWLGIIVVALLLLGWLISSWCQNMVVLAADREREQAVRDILSRIATVTNDLVLNPVGRELGAYERFRTELAAARDSFLPDPPSDACRVARTPASIGSPPGRAAGRPQVEGAGVVDNDVESAELVNCRGHRPRNVVVVADVADDREAWPPAASICAAAV